MSEIKKMYNKLWKPESKDKEQLDITDRGREKVNNKEEQRRTDFRGSSIEKNRDVKKILNEMEA